MATISTRNLATPDLPLNGLRWSCGHEADSGVAEPLIWSGAASQCGSTVLRVCSNGASAAWTVPPVRRRTVVEADDALPGGARQRVARDELPAAVGAPVVRPRQGRAVLPDRRAVRGPRREGRPGRRRGRSSLTTASLGVRLVGAAGREAERGRAPAQAAGRAELGSRTCREYKWTRPLSLMPVHASRRAPPVACADVSTTPARVYVARLVGLPIFDPQGDQVGKVRDLVVAVRSEVTQPRVLGMVAEVFGRRRIFVPMTRVTNIDSGQVYTTGLLNMRRFEQRPTETLVIGQMLDRDGPDHRAPASPARCTTSAWSRPATATGCSAGSPSRSTRRACAAAGRPTWSSGATSRA